MNIHILVAFYRKHLYKTLLHYYGKMGIILHPICDEVDIEPFKDNKLAWVKPFLCPPLKLPGQPGGEQCGQKFNYWMDARNIVDNDLYGFCDDDSMFENIFDEMKKVPDNIDVIFISNYRGDKIPNDKGAPHPVHPIIMQRIEQVKPCQIGLGEFFVRGKFLRDVGVRFDNINGASDGRFAEMLGKMCWPNAGTVLFRPDWFVLGNFFQHGRHTNKSKFLKPSWELPKIVMKDDSIVELNSLSPRWFLE